MDTYNKFGNLFLNHRFVFQQPTEIPKEPTPTEKPDKFGEYLDSQPPLEDVLDKAEKEKKQTELEGEQKKDEAKDNVLQLSEITVEGLTPKAKKAYAKWLKRLRKGKEKGPNAYAIRLKKFAKAAAKDPDIKEAYNVYIEINAPKSQRKELADAGLAAEKVTKKPEILDSQLAMDDLNNYKNIINAELGKGTASKSTAQLMLDNLQAMNNEFIEKEDYEGLAKLNSRINSEVHMIAEGLKEPATGRKFVKASVKRLQRLLG